MKRKLYALFILIGALGFLVLMYLFFYVYYTGTLTINANVDEYRVELFSTATAQKSIHECPQSVCIIRDIAPFDYNISIIKPDYKTKFLSYKIVPRGQQELVINLEKQARLDVVSSELVIETAQQKIQRIRDENLYYAKFQLDENKDIRFKDNESELLLQYVANGELKDIQSFKKIPASDILVENIYGSDNIYISLGEDRFIFETDYFRLHKLPAIKDISYIKYDALSSKYIIITSLGAFLYISGDNNLEYQYLFKDYVNNANSIIGIIFTDEDQKRKNFNITEKGNVIVKYSQKDKTRKVIYTSQNPIDEIYQKGEQIFILSGDNTFELKNFD